MKFDSVFDFLQFPVWLVIKKPKSLKSYLSYLFTFKMLKHFLFLLFKDIVFGVIFITLASIIIYLDIYVYKLNGVLILASLYIYFSFIALKNKFRRDNIISSIFLLSIFLLIASHNTEKTSNWHSSLYSNLGASLIVIVLIDNLLIKRIDNTEWKLNSIHRKQAKIEKMLKDLAKKKRKIAK